MHPLLPSYSSNAANGQPPDAALPKLSRSKKRIRTNKILKKRKKKRKKREAKTGEGKSYDGKKEVRKGEKWEEASYILFVAQMHKLRHVIVKVTSKALSDIVK